MRGKHMARDHAPFRSVEGTSHYDNSIATEQRKYVLSSGNRGISVYYSDKIQPRITRAGFRDPSEEAGRYLSATNFMSHPAIG